MARPTFPVIQAIRETARRLHTAPNYQWGHMGVCNCGFLAQVVTRYSPREIHSAAMEGHGDWSEQLNDYCPSSGLRMNALITQLVQFGFELDDLSHLERLSHPDVLNSTTIAGKQLNHNSKDDAVAYMKAWANLLEDQLITRLPNLPEYMEGSGELIMSFEVAT